MATSSLALPIRQHPARTLFIALMVAVALAVVVSIVALHGSAGHAVAHLAPSGATQDLIRMGRAQ